MDVRLGRRSEQKSELRKGEKLVQDGLIKVMLRATRAQFLSKVY